MKNKVNNPKTLRKSNNANLLWQLFNHGELSRLQLAEKCGLTTASITQLVQHLMASGIVVEQGTVQRNSTGRKEVLLSANWDKFLALGINIESDNTHIAVCSVKDIKEELVFPTSQLICNGNIDALKQKCVQIYERFAHNLLYACVGIVGRVDEKMGTAINSYGILPNDYPLATRLSETLGGSLHFEIINNVRAQARSLIAKNNLDFLYIKHLPGVGCALVTDGKLVSGQGNMAGELGHVIMDFDGRLCKCGKRGCLETIVAEENIVSAWKDLSGQERLVNEILQLFGKDEKATALLKTVADSMAIAVGNTCMIMNPKNVLLTGGMFFNKDMHAEFLNRLKTRGLNLNCSVKVVTDSVRIKAFAEARNILFKKLFEV